MGYQSLEISKYGFWTIASDLQQLAIVAQADGQGLQQLLKNWKFHWKSHWKMVGKRLENGWKMVGKWLENVFFYWIKT